MPNQPNPDDYELRDECDLSKMTIVAKGRYAPGLRVGKNVAVLAPDVTPYNEIPISPRVI